MRPCRWRSWWLLCAQSPLLACVGRTRRRVLRRRHVFLGGIAVRTYDLGTGTILGSLTLCLDLDLGMILGIFDFLYVVSVGTDTNLPELRLCWVLWMPLVVFSFKRCSLGLITYFHAVDGLTNGIWGLPGFWRAEGVVLEYSEEGCCG